MAVLILAGYVPLHAGWAEHAPQPSPDETSPVITWNTRMVEAIKRDSTPPCAAARNLAILHVAIHDALNAVVHRYTCYDTDTCAAVAEIVPAPGADPALLARVADVAGSRAFAALYPSHAGDVPPMHEAGAGESAKPGVALALRVAERTLASRVGDGSATEKHYMPLDGPGEWRRPPSQRPPELPNWAMVTPFCLESPGQFRPPPPPAPGSPAFREAQDDVRRLGAAQGSERTDEQTQVAQFWNDFSYTCTTPGHWNEIARKEVTDRDLDLLDSARVFALLNLALADAAIAAWDCKYHYNFWRPSTAIHAAGYKDWQPLLPEPPHPDYVSGHSTFSGAAAEVLSRLLPDSSAPLEVRSDSMPGVVRNFESLQACAAECGRSRIYGGVHYEFSNQAGQMVGRRVADCVLTRVLIPKSFHVAATAAQFSSAAPWSGSQQEVGAGMAGRVIGKAMYKKTDEMSLSRM